MATILKVGPNEAVKTIAQLQPKLVNDCTIQFAGGVTFDYDAGLTISRKNVTVESFGAGQATLRHKSTRSGIKPSAINISKWAENAKVHNIRFDNGMSPSSGGVVCIADSGLNTVIDANTSVGKPEYFVKALGARGAKYSNNKITLAQYVFFLGALGVKFTEFVRCNNISIFGNAGKSVEQHWLRVHQTDILDVYDNDMDGSGARSAANLRDGSQMKVHNNRRILGNIGCGALGDGAYLNDPEPQRTYFMNLQLTDVEIYQNPLIEFRKDGSYAYGVINLEMGAKDIKIHDNPGSSKMKNGAAGTGFVTPVQKFLQVTRDDRYAVRGLPTGHVWNNTVRGPAGIVDVTGPRDGLAVHDNKFIG